MSCGYSFVVLVSMTFAGVAVCHVQRTVVEVLLFGTALVAVGVLAYPWASVAVWLAWVLVNIAMRVVLPWVIDGADRAGVW